MATHYGTAVMPARVRKPRDKAKVEAGVLLVERWILARLRHKQFFALAELNAATGTLLEHLNARPFRKLPGSRGTLFYDLDRPALKALPLAPYRYAEWKRLTVPPDYHVEVDGHYYSVSYTLVGHKLEIRLTQTTVECFFKGRRVASHARSGLKGSHTTVNAHRPKAHQHYAQWNRERLLQWAERTGGSTEAVIRVILDRSAHPHQGLRSALAVLRLEKSYGANRLEGAAARALSAAARALSAAARALSAAARALSIGACSFKSIDAILKAGLDADPMATAREPVMIEHTNIRGPSYYR